MSAASSGSCEIGTRSTGIPSNRRMVVVRPIAISPILLGAGEPLFGGINALKLGYQCAEHVPTPAATHVVLRKRS